MPLEPLRLTPIMILMEGAMAEEVKETLAALTAGILMSLVVCWAVSTLTS